jgi:membrane protein DedA with SNARE-associated domain
VGNFTAYMDQFGYIVLFAALLLELIALPLPGEVLMSYTGFLIFKGNLNWLASILIAGAGASIGMTISYWIGFKLGKPFFEKYGHHFHMGPEKIEKTSLWFTKHGNKLLIIAYFIPGVRHITGYFSGITRLPFRTFSLFAYSGAFIWVTVFITIGKLLGPQWEHFHNSIKKYLIIGSIIAAIIALLIYTYKKYKVEIRNKAIQLLRMSLTIFHTQKRVSLLLTITSLLTLGFILLMIGMIQDFLGNEFSDFNEIVSLLVSSTFNNRWEGAMQIFTFMGSRLALIILIIFTLFLILFTAKNKIIELGSLTIVILGGELYEESLQAIFHNLSLSQYSIMDQLFNHFPSEQSLMDFIIYGFAVFILVRNVNKVWIQTFIPLTGMIILILIALSRLFFEVELPSDIAAGYVFGGVWLGLNILLLEIFKLLRSMNE